MKRETLKEFIDRIIIEHYKLDKSYFSSKSDKGESIMIQKEIIKTPLDAYEILSEIENKCHILVDDTTFNEYMTYGEFIDVFYKEIERERKTT